MERYSDNVMQNRTSTVLNTRRLILCLLFTLLAVHCENAFSPKDVYQERLVVYCILNPLQKMQFARVYRTYDVEGLDPLSNTVDTQVSNAVITIDAGNKHVVFKDTVVKRDSYGRYTSDIVGYYTDSLSLEPGTTYGLQVKIKDSTLVATTTAPKSASFVINDGAAVFIDPDHEKSCDCIRIHAAGAAGARGYLFKLFIEYTRSVEGQVSYLRKEVPIRFVSAGSDSVIPVYPVVDRVSGLDYSIPAFNRVLAEISSEGDNVVLGAKIIVYSFDPNFYNYYQVAHSFGDPYSIRLDAPDFTNISGGYGVFGAMSVDSLFVPKAYWGSGF